MTQWLVEEAAFAALEKEMQGSGDPAMSAEEKAWQDHLEAVRPHGVR